MTLKSDAKCEEKLPCCLENDMRNFANFHQSTWKCQNWNFDKIFLSKVENAWASNLQWSCVSWQWRVTQKFKKNWLVVLKLTWTSQILTCALEKSKNFFCLIGSLWPKYILFELQKYRGGIFHDTEKLYKFWRKTAQWFEKRHEKLGKFSPGHLKVSKLELWWDPFVQSRKGMNLKFTEELCVMTMNNNAKFWRDIDFSFQNWHEEFNKFWLDYSKI